MTPLVLIPGMMCDARLWQAVTAHLAAPLQQALPVGADTIAGLAAGILFLVAVSALITPAALTVARSYAAAAASGRERTGTITP